MKPVGSRKDHILIVRFSAMGDVVMSIHAVLQLRNTYPELKITVATKPKFAGFYEKIPDVEVLTLDREGSFKSLLRLVRAAGNSGVNLVADIHNSLRGRIIRFCLAFRGARTAAFRKNRKERASIKGKGLSIQPLRHNVLRFCDVFGRLGYPVPEPVPVRFRMPVPEVFGIRTGRWAGYAPFASKAMKIYPDALSRKLVEALSGSFDRVFIFTGPGREQEFAREMEAGFHNVTGVFGKTDIFGELALMSALDVIVTMDSSSMHLASLAGTPLVSVWGATHPAAGFMGYGYDIGKNCIQLDMACRPCSIYGEGKCRFGDYRCLSGISPEMIMQKVLQVSSSSEWNSVRR